MKFIEISGLIAIGILTGLYIPVYTPEQGFRAEYLFILVIITIAWSSICAYLEYQDYKTNSKGR